MPSREGNRVTIRTTLYDLIEAIRAEVGPEDDNLVIQTVLHVLRSQRLIWQGNVRELDPCDPTASQTRGTKSGTTR